MKSTKTSVLRMEPQNVSAVMNALWFRLNSHWISGIDVQFAKKKW